MNKKTLISYLIILALSFMLYGLRLSNSIYYASLPVLMVLLPVIVKHKIKLRFSLKDAAAGIIVSLIILVPYYFLTGGTLHKMSYSFILFQLLSVSLPEEIFFRGFLQDSTGKTFKAVIFVSLLFSLAHLPKAIFTNEWILLLSFFPSLVMGWLYMKTNNILPCTIFHLFANVVSYS